MKSLVYAIDTIGYDFRTEAERDGFRQQMDNAEVGRTRPTMITRRGAISPRQPIS